MRNSYLHNLMPSPGPQTHLTEPQRWFFNYRTNERTAFRQHYSIKPLSQYLNTEYYNFVDVKLRNRFVILCEVSRHCRSQSKPVHLQQVLPPRHQSVPPADMTSASIQRSQSWASLPHKSWCLKSPRQIDAN